MVVRFRQNWESIVQVFNRDCYSQSVANVPIKIGCVTFIPPQVGAKLAQRMAMPELSDRELDVLP
jgi:hypothetical protein